MMTDVLQYGILSFISLFVIIDPIGLIPYFLMMTERNSVEERIRMARTASITALCILLGFVFLGNWVFRIFSVSMPAFEIAGGLILLIVALDMLQAKPIAVKETREETTEGLGKENVSIT